MITLTDLSPIPDRWRGGILTIGNFDGVHRGHFALLNRLRAHADAVRAPALAVTFDPHPVVLLRPGAVPPTLVPMPRRESLLCQAGADEVAVFRTGNWLLHLTAREFFDEVIIGQFAARGLVEGPNFAFGRDRGGDNTLLARWCREAGLSFEEAPATLDGDDVISSSRIRRALAVGEADVARRLLGRPHRLEGTVIPGARRGRELGFPTANLDGVEAMIPADGVYAAWATLADDPVPRPAAVHIGPNATFGESARSVEAHLIGFDGDIYGRKLALDLLERVRPTRRFDNVDDLVAQIADDVNRARQLCALMPPGDASDPPLPPR